MKEEITIKTEASTPSFSIKARLRSFRYAFEGLNAFFSTQHNAIIHLIMTIIVFIAALFFNVSKEEGIALIIVSAIVWMAELFNTAIEKLADMVSKDLRPGIKFIKDVSAAAVLLSATAAFLTGAIIFLPKLMA
ncbi:MAG TPA: diacylglycerol kinase family protein [Chitinophagaceae bacterium]|nr:diacylglycerol kinase family protein [Chitinophagaceae bacterium]